MQLTFMEVPSGQGLTINIVGTGNEVSWSTGQPNGNSSGISMNSLSGGSLELSSVEIGPAKILISSDSAVPSRSFQMDVNVSAESTPSSFTLSASIPSGASVRAQMIGTSESHQLGATPAIFQWQP